MVGKKNSCIKYKSIGQSILGGKIYWSTQTKHHLQPWDPLESDRLQTSPHLHLFSCPIYFRENYVLGVDGPPN